MRTPSPLLSLLAAGALALTACGGDDEGSPPGQTDDGASPTTSPGPLDPGDDDQAATTGVPDGTGSPGPATDGASSPRVGQGDSAPFCSVEPDLAQIEHIEFAYPEGWQVEDGNCEFFDPELDELEEGTEPDTAIAVRVADARFREVSTSDRGTRDEVRHVGATSGYQAVRVRAESTGQGLYPEGQPILQYLVDLDPGTDDEGGTLIMTATPSDGADFAQASEALDRIAGTVRIVPTATDARAPNFVVTRVEGGGTPYAVTYDGECFRLHPGDPSTAATDEACDVDAPQEGISGVILGEGDGQVVAGLASARATLLESDAASAPYGAFTQSLEGASAFAYDAIRTPIDVRALDVRGDRIATATIGS